MSERKSIGKAELEILKFIAESGETPVRVVADHFAETKGYVRPTVLKMMERLRAKGYLERSTVDDIFVYRSTADPEQLNQDLIEDFVKGPLDGSVTPMVAYLVEQKDISKDDISRLKDLISKLEKEHKND